MLVDEKDAGGRRLSTADATRARILTSAQHAFSSRGYGDVGLRAIAAMAGCDTTLIQRYFGPKERLFERALAETLDVGPLLDGPRETFGARAAAFFGRERGTDVQPVQMLIFATSDPTSRAIALRLMDQQVVQPIADWLGGSDARKLAVRISMICSGYFLYSRILNLDPETPDADDMTDQWLAEQLQMVVESSH